MFFQLKGKQSLSKSEILSRLKLGKIRFWSCRNLVGERSLFQSIINFQRLPHTCSYHLVEHTQLKACISNHKSTPSMLFSNVSRAVATMAFMLAVSKVPAVNAEFLRRTEERQDTLFRRDDGSTLSAPYLTYQSEELESMYSYNLGTQFDPMPFGDALQLCTDLKRLCIGISLHVPQHHLWRIHFDHPSATLNDSPGSLTVVKNPANEEACPTTPYGCKLIRYQVFYAAAACTQHMV